MLSKKDIEAIHRVRQAYLQQLHELETYITKETDLESTQCQCFSFSGFLLENNRHLISKLEVQVPSDRNPTSSVEQSSVTMYVIQAFTIKVDTSDFRYSVRRDMQQFFVLYREITQNYQTITAKNRNTDKSQQIIYTFPKENKEGLVASISAAFHAGRQENRPAVKYKKQSHRVATQLTELLQQVKDNYYFFQNQSRSSCSHLAQHAKHAYLLLLEFVGFEDQVSNMWKIREQQMFTKGQLSTTRQSNSTDNHDFELIDQCESSRVKSLNQIIQYSLYRINLTVPFINFTDTQSSISSHTDSFATILRESWEESRRKPSSERGSIGSSSSDVIKCTKRIGEVVLELEKKIYTTTVNSIVLGNTGREHATGSNSKPIAQKGLIEYALKDCRNQFVTSFILKTVMKILLNSEVNCSSDAFEKFLRQLPINKLCLNEYLADAAMSQHQMRVLYFELIDFYIRTKETEGIQWPSDNAKSAECDSTLNFSNLSAIMNIRLVNSFQKWQQGICKLQKFKKKICSPLNNQEDTAEGKILNYASSIRNKTRSEEVYAKNREFKQCDNKPLSQICFSHGYELFRCVLQEERETLNNRLRKDSTELNKFLMRTCSEEIIIDSDPNDELTSSLKQQPNRLISSNPRMREQKVNEQQICKYEPVLTLIKYEKEGGLEMKLETAQSSAYNYYHLLAEVSQTNNTNKFQSIKNAFSTEQNWNPFLRSSEYDSYSNTIRQEIQVPGKSEKVFKFTVLQRNSDKQSQELITLKTQTDTLDSLNASNDKVLNSFSIYKKPPNKEEASQSAQLQNHFCNSYYQLVSVRELSSKISIIVEFLFYQKHTKSYFLSQVSGSTSQIFNQVKKMVRKELL